MPEVNEFAIAVSAAAAFVASAVWYTLLGSQYAALSDAARAAVGTRMPAWKILAELARSLVVAAVLAGLAVELDITTWPAALGLGVATWVGFPVVLLAGSVLSENVPWRLAAIHAGDWLVKLLLVSWIVSLWR
jgi:hypothetical protein